MQLIYYKLIVNKIICIYIDNNCKYKLYYSIKNIENNYNTMYNYVNNVKQFFSNKIDFKYLNYINNIVTNYKNDDFIKRNKICLMATYI